MKRDITAKPVNIGYPKMKFTLRAITITAKTASMTDMYLAVDVVKQRLLTTQ
jgi:hypothetical protein